MPTYLALDTETHLIRPGLVAPPLVCVSGYENDEAGAWLHKPNVALPYVRSVLKDHDTHIVIHNAAFDLAVFCAEDDTLLPLVLDALEAGRVHCTMVRGKMLWNAREGLSDDGGRPVGFSLADEVQRRFDVDLSDSKKGADSWRLRYAELEDVPLDQWPADAVTYAKDDAVWHLRVFQDQEQERRNYGGDALADEAGQTWAAFFLHLMGCWGIRTEEAAVQTLVSTLTEHVEAANEKLRAAGLMTGKAVTDKVTGALTVEWTKNTKKIKALVEAALGADAPRTPPSEKFPDGQVKTDEETLRATNHPDLIALADAGSDAKALSVWGDALQGKNKKGVQTGLRTPDGWLLQPKWNFLVASGRTSVYDPPVQQLPRKGDVRPCFVPRPGYWFLSVDYSFIELVTWAQTCIDLVGFSMMAEAIKAGMDPHVDMGAEILRAEGREVDYKSLNAARKAGEVWAKDARQLAKAANFGLMGGLGAGTFIDYAWATYGVRLTESKAWQVKRAWQTKWPESVQFFAHFSRLSQEAFGEKFRVALPRSGFIRGGCSYTSGCNTTFQGLAARGAKEAMLPLMRDMYVDESSALFGCRPVLFIHDEFILEVPVHRERAHLASELLCKRMVDGMQKFTPDVPVKVEPTLMARWYKEAEPVWGSDGVLELWHPKEAQ
jgi:hypothetical protein